VAQVCHIEAAEPEGERYNPSSNDEQRRSLENLILLCYPHHVETDDVVEFPTERLKEMKRVHEDKCGLKNFKINEATLYQIEHQMESYWAHITKLNSDHHVAPNYAVPIRPKSSPIEIFADIWSAFHRIVELTEFLHRCDSKLNSDVREHLLKLGYDLAAYYALPYHANSFDSRLLEIHNLAFPNSFTDISMAISIAEIQHLQEYLKTHPNDSKVSTHLNETKAELQQIADKVGYVD
jgi:hypothetical protein